MKTEEQKKKHAEYMRDWRFKNADEQRVEHATYMREWRTKNKVDMKVWRAANSDKILEYRNRCKIKLKEEGETERYKKLRKNQREYLVKYRKTNPLKNKAHRLVSTAILKGELVKGVCEHCLKEGIDNATVDAHHDDYNKPLDVIWLCKKHHTHLHMKGREDE